MSLLQSHSRCLLFLTAPLLLLTALLLLPLSAMCEDTVPAPYSTTSTRDTLVTGDSIIVIHTVCAPVCSSCARVYNKEWTLIGTLTPPFRSPFPEAYIENGKLLWRDNYPQLMDNDELRLGDDAARVVILSYTNHPLFLGRRGSAWGTTRLASSTTNIRQTTVAIHNS